MKLKIHEIIILAVTALALTFCAGFFIGRSSGNHKLSVTLQSAATSDTSENNETIADSYVSVDTDKININTAGVSELMSLPGISMTMAERIIEYREKNGGFGNTWEIVSIYGISESVYEEISQSITVE